jgi:phosphatidylglycerol:prolipoprotein diacylglycerol transferase
MQHSPEIIAFFEGSRGGISELEAILHPRHPSQIYEALGEGLFLFLLLFLLRTRCPRLPNGLLTGLFFLIYAVIRIILEAYRQPDSGAESILGMTKGQFFSTFMIVTGLAFLSFAWVTRHSKSNTR